jgi:hypothetical protein
MVPVVSQSGFEHGRIHPVPPVSRHEIHIEPQPPRHLRPGPGELADIESEHAIARGERIDQRRFPTTGARRRKHQHWRFRLEDSF